LVNLGQFLFARSRYKAFSIGVRAGQEFMLGTAADTAAEGATLFALTIDFKDPVPTLADCLLPLVDRPLLLPCRHDKVVARSGRLIAVPVAAVSSKRHFTLPSPNVQVQQQGGPERRIAAESRIARAVYCNGWFVFIHHECHLLHPTSAKQAIKG